MRTPFFIAIVPVIVSLITIYTIAHKQISYQSSLINQNISLERQHAADKITNMLAPIILNNMDQSDSSKPANLIALNTPSALEDLLEEPLKKTDITNTILMYKQDICWNLFETSNVPCSYNEQTNTRIYKIVPNTLYTVAFEFENDTATMQAKLRTTQITYIAIILACLTLMLFAAYWWGWRGILQKRQTKLMNSAKNALVKAIEIRDPYLDGHSDKMAKLAVKIGLALKFSDTQLQELETAAHLSQIGKLCISRDLLTKTDRYSDEEILEMQKHIEHARDILQQTAFSQNIIDSVSQMYERTDGSGYPNQLQGDNICLNAQILGIADYVIARTTPRSYRDAANIDEIITVLKQHPNKYNRQIVELLPQVR